MTTNALLTAGQMRRIQEFAMRGMQTPVTVLRRSAESGLEDTDDPYGSLPEWNDITPIGGLLGWLHSTPTPMQIVSTGQIVTANTYRLYLPVGTDIAPGDHVIMASETSVTQTYVVSDTTADESWPALLNCSLRLME